MNSLYFCMLDPSWSMNIFKSALYSGELDGMAKWVERLSPILVNWDIQTS